MTSHSSPSRPEPCAPVDWLELPADVSASIIRRVDLFDILISVQCVCTKWRRICRDPSMWTSINCCLYLLDTDFPYDLSKLYRLAVDLSSGGLLDVNLDIFSVGLLRYITDRSKHLRRFCLGSPVYSEAVFMEVAAKFPLVEELDLSACHFSSEVVATIGRSSPLLYSFKFRADDDTAFAIAKNMPGLRHLRICGESLTNVGLVAILDGCQHLESLNLTPCIGVKLDDDLRKRCERIKDFHAPDDTLSKFIAQMMTMVPIVDEYELIADLASIYDDEI